MKLNPNFAFFDTLMFCLGDTFDFFGTPIFEQGDFQHVEQTSLGCDSVFNVKIIPARDTAFFTQSEGICRGDTILVFGNDVFEAGIFTQIDDNGFCVTVEEFEVTINEISETFDTLGTCLGSPISVFDFETDVSDTYLETYNRIGNCDSVHSIHVIAKDTFFNIDKLQICSNQEADIFGNLTNIPGIYTKSYSAQNGCDSTSVIELLVSDTLRTGEVRSFCQNDSILVFGNYETMPGSYLQNALSVSGCDSIHEVILEYFPDFQFMTSSENTCFQDSSGSAAILIDNLPNAKFLWENGSSESTILDLKPGLYQFTVTDENGCEKTDSVLVENKSFEIITDELPPLCFGESNGSIETISADSGLEFSLNDVPFSTQNIFENLPSGNYSITVRNSNNCILKTKIELSDPEILTVLLPEDTLINIGESIQLIPNSNGLPSNFSWEPDINLNCADCPTVIARPESEITYFLQIEDANGCFASDSILIEIVAGNKYFIPKAFSPNKDGHNDFFTIYGNRNLKNIQKLLIFDNWGELIWKGEDFPPNINDLGWDGKFREKEMNNGVFVFYTILEFSNGETVIEKGDLTLIR